MSITIDGHELRNLWEYFGADGAAFRQWVGTDDFYASTRLPVARAYVDGACAYPELDFVIRARGSVTVPVVLSYLDSSKAQVTQSGTVTKKIAVAVGSPTPIEPYGTTRISSDPVGFDASSSDLHGGFPCSLNVPGSATYPTVYLLEKLGQSSRAEIDATEAYIDYLVSFETDLTLPTEIYNSYDESIMLFGSDFMTKFNSLNGAIIHSWEHWDPVFFDDDSGFSEAAFTFPNSQNSKMLHFADSAHLVESLAGYLGQPRRYEAIHDDAMWLLSGSMKWGGESGGVVNMLGPTARGRKADSTVVEAMAKLSFGGAFLTEITYRNYDGDGNITEEAPEEMRRASLGDLID